MASVTAISICDMRENAIGTDSRNRSAMSAGRAQAVQPRRCVRMELSFLARFQGGSAGGSDGLELLGDQEGQFKGLFAIEARIAMGVVSR